MPALSVARQKWRAWIETLPFSHAERVLGPSPVRNGGRGLKHASGTRLGRVRLRRPSEMAGVD